MQVQFYHLTATPMERALPRLLEKAYGAGLRTQCMIDSLERLTYLDDVLWTYDPNSFLPHGTATQPHAASQPILLTTALEERENNPTVLLATEGSMPEADMYERVLDVFDGNNEETLAAARTRWKQYRDTGHNVSYYRQTVQGGWEKKA